MNCVAHGNQYSVSPCLFSLVPVDLQSRFSSVLKLKCLIFVVQVEGTATVLSSVTYSVPSSQWKLPAKSTNTASNRYQEVLFHLSFIYGYMKYEGFCDFLCDVSVKHKSRSRWWNDVQLFTHTGSWLYFNTRYDTFWN